MEQESEVRLFVVFLPITGVIQNSSSIHGDWFFTSYFVFSLHISTLPSHSILWKLQIISKSRVDFIPGIRPGKPTSDYLTNILNYIIFIGAVGLYHCVRDSVLLQWCIRSKCFIRWYIYHHYCWCYPGNCETD